MPDGDIIVDALPTSAELEKNVRQNESQEHLCVLPKKSNEIPIENINSDDCKITEVNENCNSVLSTLKQNENIDSSSIFENVADIAPELKVSLENAENSDDNKKNVTNVTGDSGTRSNDIEPGDNSVEPSDNMEERLNEEVEIDRTSTIRITESDDSNADTQEEGLSDSESLRYSISSDIVRENEDEQETKDTDSESELDDDEDSKKPQYIPKRGYFYEHDDRTTIDEVVETISKDHTITENGSKSKESRIPDGKWKHDLYRENEQTRKSYSRRMKNTRSNESHFNASEQRHIPHQFVRKSRYSTTHSYPARKSGLTPKSKPVSSRRTENKYAITQKSRSHTRSSENGEQFQTFRPPYAAHSQTPKNSSPSISESNFARNGSRARFSKKNTSSRISRSPYFQDDFYSTSCRSSGSHHFENNNHAKAPRRCRFITQTSNYQSIKNSRSRRFSEIPDSQNRQNGYSVRTSKKQRFQGVNKVQNRQSDLRAKSPVNYRQSYPVRSPNRRSANGDSKLTEYKCKREQKSPEKKTTEECSNNFSRSYSKRFPNSERNTKTEFNRKSKSNPQFTKVIVNSNEVRGNLEEVTDNRNNFLECSHYHQVSKNLTNSNNYVYGNRRSVDYSIHDRSGGEKSTNYSLRDLTKRMADVSLQPTKNNFDKEEFERKSFLDTRNEIWEAPCMMRSKRYSHQMQRLLPELNSESNLFGLNAPSSGMNGSIESTTVPMSSMTSSNISSSTSSQTAIRASLHNSTPVLPVNSAIPPTSAVPTPFIPLSSSSIPVLGETSLQSNVRTLPFLGYYQHPQGFSNRGSHSQYYTNEQHFKGFPSFIPSGSVMSSNIHTTTVTPPIYPLSTVSYSQVAPTNEEALTTINSKTYPMASVSVGQIRPPCGLWE